MCLEIYSINPVWFTSPDLYRCTSVTRFVVFSDLASYFNLVFSYHCWSRKTLNAGKIPTVLPILPIKMFMIWKTLSYNFSSSRHDRKNLITDSESALKIALENGLKCAFKYFWDR